jgi:ParB-like chromosome segregation protein Spo0J
MSTNPIDNVEWVAPGSLVANHYNPNRVHKAEARLLEFSLVTIGWIQPLLANRNRVIIDGFHRWALAKDSVKVQQLTDPPGLVPVAFLDVGDDEAMAITVRINRAKGSHVAVELHKLVFALLNVHGWDRKRIAREIGATPAEVDVLAQDGVFAAKDIANWKYSPAWYPVEAAERPPEKNPV